MAATKGRYVYMHVTCVHACDMYMHVTCMYMHVTLTCYMYVHMQMSDHSHYAWSSGSMSNESGSSRIFQRTISAQVRVQSQWWGVRDLTVRELPLGLGGVASR